MNTPTTYKEIEEMFGHPANADGTLNALWETNNIQLVSPPRWKLCYQNSATSLSPINGIHIHRLLAASFLQVMEAIWQYAKAQLPPNATDADIQVWLAVRRLNQTGGGYNFRKSTGNASKLSLHAFGIAIDWDPVHNPRSKKLIKTLPDWWYAIWASYGWTDGRHFKTPDPMHVQFAKGV